MERVASIMKYTKLPIAFFDVYEAYLKMRIMKCKLASLPKRTATTSVEGFMNKWAVSFTVL
jgi:hypothetical protein